MLFLYNWEFQSLLWLQFFSAASLQCSRIPCWHCGSGMVGKLRQGDKKKIISVWECKQIQSNCIIIVWLLRKCCLPWVSFLFLGFCLSGNWSKELDAPVGLGAGSQLCGFAAPPVTKLFQTAGIRKQSSFRKCGQEVQCCPTGGTGDTQVRTGCVYLAGFAPATWSYHGFPGPDWEVDVSLLTVPPRQQWPDWAPHVPPSRRHLCCQWGTEVVAPAASLVPGGEPVPFPGRAVIPAELCQPPLLPLFIPFICCRCFFPVPGVSLDMSCRPVQAEHSGFGAATSSTWTTMGRKAELAFDVNECIKF